jgi:hypothetical protein
VVEVLAEVGRPVGGRRVRELVGQCGPVPAANPVGHALIAVGDVGRHDRQRVAAGEESAGRAGADEHLRTADGVVAGDQRHLPVHETRRMVLTLVERVRRVGELGARPGAGQRVAGAGTAGDHRHRLADHSGGRREVRPDGPVQLTRSAARPGEQPDQHADGGTDHHIHHAGLGQPPVHR